VLEPEADPELVGAEVSAAAAAVRSGEVVEATRDAATPLGPVTAGQPLGLAEGRLVAAAADPVAALRAVCEALEVTDAEVVTLLHGAAASTEERDATVSLLRELAPGAELEVIDAGVAPERCWVGVE